MFKFIAALLSGPTGKPSSTRLSMVFVVGCIMGVWSIVSIQKEELQKLDEWHVGVIAVAMGANVGTKMVAKSKEQPPRTENPRAGCPTRG